MSKSSIISGGTSSGFTSGEATLLLYFVNHDTTDFSDFFTKKEEEGYQKERHKVIIFFLKIKIDTLATPLSTRMNGDTSERVMLNKVPSLQIDCVIPPFSHFCWLVSLWVTQGFRFRAHSEALCTSHSALHHYQLNYLQVRHSLLINI